LLDIITGERGNAKPRVARSRISRMVPAAPHRDAAPTADAPVAPPELQVTLVDGACDPTTAAALVTAGAMGSLRCVADTERGEAAVDGVVVFGANAAQVAAWSPHKPVMVVVGNDNLEVAMAMLRAGAAEVVTADAGAAAIVAKLRKMITTAQRKAKRS